MERTSSYMQQPPFMSLGYMLTFASVLYVEIGGVGIQWILFAEHNVGTYTYLCKLISFIAVAKLRAIFSRLDLCQLIPRKLLLDFNWSLSLCANNRYLKFGCGLA